MTCSCGKSLSIFRMLFATISRPIQCQECGKFIYSKTPISEPLIVLFGVILIFVSIFLLVKKEWLYLVVSLVAFSVLIFSVRLVEVKLVGLRLENEDRLKSVKNADFFVRMVWGGIFVLLMIVAYLFF